MMDFKTAYRSANFSILTLVLVLVLFRVPGLRNLERVSYDARLRLEKSLGLLTPSEDILVLGIDDQSLDNYGRWPWPRGHLADLIEVLARLDAREVFLDINFVDPAGEIRGGTLSSWSFGDQVMDILDAEMSSQSQDLGIDSDPVARAAADLHAHSMRILYQRIGLMRPRSPDVRLAEALEFSRSRGTRTASVFTVQGVSSHDSPTEFLDRGRAWVMENPDRPLQQLPPNIAANLGRDRPTLEKYKALFSILDARFPSTGIRRQQWWVQEVDENLRGYVAQHAAEVAGDVLQHQARAFLDSRAGTPGSQDVMALSREFGGRYPVGEDYARAVIDDEMSRRLIALRHSFRIRGVEQLTLPRGRRILPPIVPFTAAFDGLGADNRVPDEDGVLRSVPLVWDVEGLFVPSSALNLFAQGTGSADATEGPALIAVERGPRLGIDAVSGERLSIPVTPSGRLRIHWTGPFDDSFQVLSVGYVLDLATSLAQRRAFFRDRATDGLHESMQRYLRLAVSQSLVDPGRPLDLVTLGEQVAAARESTTVDPEEFVDRGQKEYAALNPPATLQEQRPAQDWIRYFEGRIRAWEDGWVETMNRGIARVEERYKEDPETLALKKARYVEALAPLTRIDAVIERLESDLRHRVAGKYCLVGSTASSSTDLAPMPFDSVNPNIGMYANALDTVLSRRFLVRPEVFSWDLAGLVDQEVLQFPFLLLVVLLLPAVLMNQSALGGALFTVTFIVSWILMATALFITKGVWVDIVAPICASVVAYALVYTWRYFRSEHVRRVFESYVDPRIVSVVVDNEHLWKELGGIEQEITPFFSDIANFTTISELLAPEELSAMLTDYLSPMTEIIHNHEGILDKYIGDAIVGFFGSPIKTPDHAFRGCVAALEQQALLVELKKKWERDGVAWYRKMQQARLEMSFRVGLNTGRAKVGNFGSQTTKNYTMIGDIVNLAARLEGANKQYNTLIMASEFIVAACSSAIMFRELDRIKVKGKTEAVGVFEVLGLPDQLDSELEALLEVYRRALDVYYQRDFEQSRRIFESALELRPGDGPSRVYLDRCYAYLENPPPDEWDGVYIMTTK